MIRIAITGPECSGKTTLAIALGKELDVNFIPEFARHYLNNLDRPYDQNDLDIIARKQQEVIGLITKTASKYMVVDTEMLVLKIWSQEKYNMVSSFIQTAYEIQDFSLIVLCKPNIPFEADLQRENPLDRDRLYQIYKAELESQTVLFVEVKGTPEQRLDTVLTAISELISK